MIEQLQVIIFSFIFFGVFVALLSEVFLIGLLNFIVFTELMIISGNLDSRWHFLMVFILGLYMIYLTFKNQNVMGAVITGHYTPIIDRNSISKLKCPICENEIGIDKDFVVTPDKTIYHFDCYISQSEEHERR